MKSEDGYTPRFLLPPIILRLRSCQTTIAGLHDKDAEENVPTLDEETGRTRCELERIRQSAGNAKTMDDEVADALIKQGYIDLTE